MNYADPFSTNAPVIEPVIDPNAVDPNAVDPNKPPGDPNAPIPAVVSQEEFDKMKADMVANQEASNKVITDLNSQVLQSNQLMQNGMANFTPQGVAPVAEITEEQVVEAMNNGEPNAVGMMKKFIQQSGNEEIESLKTEMKTMRDQGQLSLTKLAQGAGTQGLTYYDKYKEEIEQVVKGSAAHLQTDPETYRQAHNFVVGQHMDEIITQAKEEAIRTASAPGEPGSATIGDRGQNSGRNLEQGKLDLSHENVFSASALRQLRSRGMTPEQLAKDTGFESYEAFAKYKLEGEGRMIPNEPANA